MGGGGEINYSKGYRWHRLISGGAGNDNSVVSRLRDIPNRVLIREYQAPGQRRGDRAGPQRL